MKTRAPGWKKRPRKSKYDNTPSDQIASALREHGTLHEAAKKLGMGKAALRKLVEKHSLQAAWNEGHDDRLDRLDEAKEPEREKKRAEVSAEIEAAKSDAERHTKTLFNAWSIPMSEQKKAERALSEAHATARNRQSKLRSLQKQRRTA
jgi:hypothetical protein